MADAFSGQAVAADTAAINGAVLTPSDSVDLATVTRGLWVGTAGNVQVRLVNDTTAIVLQNVPAGSLLPLRVARLYATNTSAGSLVGLS